jgi:chaperonin GroEL
VAKRVVFDLQARKAVKRGFDQIARLAEVTLGPVGGVVAYEKLIGRDSSPELLSDTATIARRIIEIPGQFDNMGAMLARHMAWKMHEEVGDGAATALVMAKSVIDDGLRFVSAGHNAMTLWHGLKKLLGPVDESLTSMSRPLDSQEQIAALATSLVGSETIGGFIEEAFDIVGPQGFVEVRSAYGMQDDREYVEGSYWDSGWISPYFADKNTGTQATVEKPYILVTDYDLSSAQDLVPVLQRVRTDGGKSVVIIAGNIRESALNLMVSNNAKGTLRLLGLKAPRVGDMRRGVLEDIAISCGARFVRKDAGDDITQVKAEDLGHAQTVVCNRGTFTLIGTMGKPQVIRERIRDLQRRRENADERAERDQLDERVGKLLGGTALLHVSGDSKEDRDRRKEVVENAVQVVRLGLQGGIVAGGCSAYLAALSALDDVELAADEEPVREMMRHALVAPLYKLVENAGFDPGPVLVDVQEAPAGWGFDVTQGKIVDMCEANIVDPLPTVRSAFAYAMSAAMMALTTDVLIHRDQPGTPNLNP